MITKIISLAAAITTVDIAVRSQLDPTAPIYNFASNGMWVNVLMVIFVGLSVAISFKPKNGFKSWYSYSACMTLAVLLIVIGGLGTFYSNFILDGWDLMLPLNYLMLLECGMVLAICGLSYKHVKRPFSVSLTLPRSATAAVKEPAMAVASGMRTAYQAIRNSGAAAAQRMTAPNH